MIIEQLLVHHVAATLAAGVIANLPDNMPVDPTIANPEIRADLATTWEIHKAFYAAIAKSIGDETWAKIPSDKGIIQGIAEQIGPALTGQGPLGAILAPILAKVLGGTTPAAPPLLK